MDQVNFEETETNLLYHHSDAPYSITAGKAAEAARNQIQTLLDRGKQRSTVLLREIESSVPKDYGILPNTLAFMWDDSEEENGPVRLLVQANRSGDDQTDPFFKGTMTGPAYDKLLAAIGGSKRFFNHLEKTEPGRALLLHNLRELTQMQKDTILLMRTNGEEIRAFLTENYQRLDSHMILEAFLEELSYLGGVIIDGVCAKHSWEIKVLLPEIYEPLKNEVVAFGFTLSNSDYGQGSLKISMFMHRLWCSNTAVSQDCLRKVHIDKSNAPPQQKWSAATREAVTRAEIAQMREAIRNVVSQNAVNRMLTTIVEASEKKIAPSQVRSYLKETFSKSEMEAILKSYEDEEDISKIPAMPGTVYRLVNAMTLHSQNFSDPERRMEVEDLAGKLMGLNPNRPVDEKGKPIAEENLMEFFPVLEIPSERAERPSRGEVSAPDTSINERFAYLDL